MGLFFSKQIRGGDGRPLSLDVIASRPKLEPHEIGFLHLTSHGEYATLAAHVYGAGAPETAVQVDLPDGWEIFLECSSLSLNREGYFAVAYVHRGWRHCVIAERGTSEVLGLRAGIWVYFEQPTIQLFLAEQFSKAVRQALAVMDGGRGEEWFVSYTGHSLGAVIAACRAVEEGTLAVTFESPGAREFLEKTLEAPSGIDEHVITYLRAPNPINTLKSHCGYTIMIPTQQVVLPSGTLFLAPARTVPLKDEAIGPQSSARSMRKALRASRTAPTSSLQVDQGTGPGVTAVSAPSSGSVKVAISSVTPSVGSSTPAATSVASAASASSVPIGSSSSTTQGAHAAKAQARWRVPSFRPHEYLRGYLLGGVGTGVPELQQYVGKVEPMIREMLEHTQQVHSIHSLRGHFLKKDEPGGEEVVLRWPSHIMQFMEFYNTTRALEDPDNQDVRVKEAYMALMRRLYYTVPRRRDCIPTKYIHRTSLLVLQLWWSMDAAQRKQWPLSLMDHKALNTIQIKDGYLCSYVLTAMQAKQYLLRLVSRSEVSAMIDQWRKERAGGSLSSMSKL